MSRLYRNNQDQYEQTERIINNRLAFVNTNMLVEVKGIVGGLLTVQPTGLRFYTNNNLKQESQEYGEFDVNVIQINGIVAPITVGQIGLLIINQYDIENVTEGSDPINRRFDILDGVFLPVVVSADAISTDTLTLSGENLVTHFSSTKIENSSNDSLIAVLISALEVLKNLETTGGYVLIPSDLIDLQLEIDKLQAFNP